MLQVDVFIDTIPDMYIIRGSIADTIPSILEEILYCTGLTDKSEQLWMISIKTDTSNCTKCKIGTIIIYIPMLVSKLGHLIYFPSYFAFPFFLPSEKNEQGNTLAE